MRPQATTGQARPRRQPTDEAEGVGTAAPRGAPRPRRGGAAAPAPPEARRRPPLSGARGAHPRGGTKGPRLHRPAARRPRRHRSGPCRRGDGAAAAPLAAQAEGCRGRRHVRARGVSDFRLLCWFHQQIMNGFWTCCYYGSPPVRLVAVSKAARQTTQATTDSVPLSSLGCCPCSPESNPLHGVWMLACCGAARVS